jgi:metallophosphoesterase (TIGR00282 family)
LKLLFFGDVYGQPGREAVKHALSELTLKHSIDFIILNGENMTHGNGLSPGHADEFYDLGVDVITLGNHAWDKKEIIPYMSTTTRLLRPLNYPDHPQFRTPGRGSTVVECRKRKLPNGKPLQLAVIQVMGRVFMDALECPFRVAEKEVHKFNELGIQNILIDFHGEATSEKNAFTHFLDGKVSAILGTHSHVQTADERITPLGTAAITDVGMSGCFDSVIGVKKELSIQKFLSKRPVKYEAAIGPGGYGCVIVDIDELSGKATHIQRIRKTSLT